MASLRERLDDLCPIGLAPVLLLVGLLVAGTYLLLVPAERGTGTITYWTFAGGHQEAYEAAKGAWEQRHPGESVDVQLVHNNAVTQRLRSAFWTGGNVPDLVEVEISRAGTFFRGPVERIGFVDLKPFIERSGLDRRIPASRLAPYTNRGRIFGLPHDVHPVLFAYRADLVEPLLAEQGLTIDDLDTWDKFIAFGQRITRRGQRYLIQFSDSDTSSLETLYLQRGGNFFSQTGELQLDDPLLLDTLCWFIPLAAGDGERRIAVNAAWGAPFYQALQQGYFLMVVCPDWRTKSIEDNCPDLAGKMKLMQLPAWEPGGARTSTWGGTMLGITKDTADVELAWSLAEHFYFSEAEAGQRFAGNNILPPDRGVWNQPEFHASRPYWSGQAIGSAYIQVCDEVPGQHGSPFLEMAKAKMTDVVAACSDHVRRHGEAGLREYAAERLRQAQAAVAQQMRREPDWGDAPRAEMP